MASARNEANLGRRRKKSGGDAQPIRLSLRAGSTKSRNVQNEPNFPPPKGNRAKRTRVGSAGHGVPDGASSVELQVSGQEGLPCRPLTSNFKPQTSHFPPEIVQNEAKLGGDWGMWAEAVVVWDVARPDNETCKTNPIWSRL